MDPELTPDLLLRGYAAGIFPMAEGRDDPEVFWVDPRHRGILPLDGFHISRSLAKIIAREQFSVTVDTAFASVVQGCANRAETWINAPIARLYSALHAAGHAHSVEVWDDGALVGGVYGVTLGAAFFGESMFSVRPNASKVALAYLVHRLRAGGFVLFDTQFVTDHLISLGAIEVPRAAYRKQLEQALRQKADFGAAPAQPAPQDIVQRKTHTS
jgi:leucyl/phenylalanyl-tRNA--protein transferase